MKIRLELGGTVFEYERHPLPEHRFRAICVLVAAGLYVGMVWTVTALCGIGGLLVLSCLTAVTLLFGGLFKMAQSI